MALPTFILNDEEVYTSHGFYLLNSGARLDRFRANPVMLDNHCDDRVIGRWQGLSVEGSRLFATPEFDDGSELGKERRGQVERGFLRGASLGLYILAAEERTDPATGERRLYVTEWEPLEASIVAIPSNAGALTLRVFDADRRPVAAEQLGAYLSEIVQLTVNQKNMTNKTESPGGTPAPAVVSLSAAAQVALGLSGSPDGAAISAAVIELAAATEQAKAECEKLKQEIAAQKQAQVKAMVSLAVKEGRITADQQANYEKLGAADYEATRSALEALPVRTSLGAQIRSTAGGGSIPAERQAWNLCRWMREDMPGLQRLKAEEPETYAEILKKQ